jgi:hypothetical protein
MVARLVFDLINDILSELLQAVQSDFELHPPAVPVELGAEVVHF